MSGLITKPLKAIITPVQNKITISTKLKSLDIPLNSFCTVGDLLIYLSSQGAVQPRISSLDGIAYNPAMLVNDAKKDPFLLSFDEDTFKIVPSHSNFQFSALELFDSLNLPAKERDLIQHVLKHLNVIYKTKKTATKDEISEVFERSIREGKSSYVQRYERLRYLEQQYAEKIEDYLKIRKVAERFATKALWGGFCIITLQWAYIGIGTYVFFSWDIMEPQAYTINLGNAILIYAAYVLTKKELTRESVFEMIRDWKIGKISAQKGFDIKTFNDNVNEWKALQQYFRNT
jgi:hypothetical protein